MRKNDTLLVTGAGGFIGGWVAEAAYLSKKVNVRAAVRTWSSATRIARFPIEIVLCDILNNYQLEKAFDGASYVVHCALGGKEGIIEGTKNALEVALKKKVKRFVFLSSIVVYGEANDEVDENTPFEYTGDDYTDSKIEAEKICNDYSKKGLPITILRPPIVYGPFSKQWTTGIADKLLSGKWGTLGRDGEGICNLLYIEDLLQAIFLALENDNAVGEAFNINGNEKITWNQYYAKFNKSLGMEELKEIDTNKMMLKSTAMMPIRNLAGYLLKNYRGLVMRYYSRYELISKCIKIVEKALKTTPSRNELNLQKRNSFYLIKKAQEKLGYTPKYNIERGLEMSVGWLKHQGFNNKR